MTTCDESEIIGTLVYEFPSKDTRFISERIYYYRSGIGVVITNYAFSRRDQKWHSGMCYEIDYETLTGFALVADRIAKGT